MEYKGLAYMRRKLQKKRPRALLRYKFYDMKNIVKDFYISTPPELRNYMGCLGWCGKSVDSIGDRLSIKGFKNDNFGIGEIYSMNNASVLTGSAINGALTTACDFIYISADETGYPRMQVIDGSNATGIMDHITGFLKEGYAVLERDDKGNPVIEAWFGVGRTEYYYKDGRIDVFLNNAPFPLLVPIIHKPTETREFGHSRISRSCMYITSAAVRSLKRSEIAAEFFSFPQKYITGLAEDAPQIEKWDAAMSALMTFTVDGNGNAPKLGQFEQQSMSPHSDQLKMWAGLFCGETGLTMDDLGFPTANPSSGDAIVANHESLRLMAKRAQETFGTGFINAGYLAACVRDNMPYQREVFYETQVKWNPIFPVDVTRFAGAGDAFIKINDAVPGYLTEEKLEEILGI